MVFLHGHSGMGKSYLLRRFVRRIRREEPGAVVLVGRCTEEGSAPYKALDSLMEDLARLPGAACRRARPRSCCRATSTAWPGCSRCCSGYGRSAAASQAPPPSPDPQELRRRAFAALRELLMRMGTRHPLVLVIEDLQWGDLDSEALLSNLLRDPDPPSMLVLLTYRTEDSEPVPAFRALQRRLAEEGTEVVEVPIEKIPRAESEALARALLGSYRSDVEAEGAWIAKESGGNPFFIGELSRHLRSGIRVLHGPGEQTLDAYILFRVGALPEAARIILETLALAGHPVEWDVLRRACRIEPAGAEALTPLRAGHLIRARGAHGMLLEPYHDRIRQSVLRGFPEAKARALHLALAKAMEQSMEPDAQALCLHFQAAGAQAKAGEYALVAAGRAVKALAFARAAEFYRLALRLKEPKGAEYLGILLNLADALAGAGLGNKAAQAYLEALPIAPRKDGLRLQRRASEEYFRSGRFDQGEAALEAVMDRIGMKLAQAPWRTRLLELFCRLRLRLRGLRLPAAGRGPGAPGATWTGSTSAGPRPWGWGRWTTSAAAPSRPATCCSRCARASRSASCAPWPWRPSTFRTGATGAAGPPSGSRTSPWPWPSGSAIPNPLGRALVAAGTAALMQGRWKPAVEMLERAEALLKDNCAGLDFELHLAQYHALLARQQMGSLRDMEIRLSARIQAAQDKGDLLALTNLKTGISPQVHLAHDEPARAMRELQQTIGEWSSAGFHLQHYNALVSKAEVLLYFSDPEQAYGVVSRHWLLLRRSLLLRIQHVRVTCLELRARAALAVVLQGRPDPARSRSLLRLASGDRRRIEQEGVGYGDALALRLRALEALALGRPDEAGALLFQAELAFQACGMALHAMVARHRRGRMEGPSGAEQVDAAERWMRGQKIVSPQRFVAMHFPG